MTKTIKVRTKPKVLGNSITMKEFEAEINDVFEKLVAAEEAERDAMADDCGDCGDDRWA